MGKKCDCPKGLPAWFATFGDMMSLLLCFFIMLLSFSTMDQAMYKEVSGSLRDALGVQRDEITYDVPMGTDSISRDFNPTFSVDVILEKIKSAVNLEFIKGEIEIEALEDRVVLRLNDDLTFEPGKADLTDKARALLDKIRPIVETVPGELMVSGHTDDVVINTTLYPSNWGLSAARAASVVDYLLLPRTIDPRRLAAIGFGDSRPIVPNTTPENRKRNRRVELTFLQSPRPDEIDIRPLTGKGLREQEILPAPIK
ncbi:MAG: OmpA family protein [Deltaproteobacteria bacterium]